MAETIIQNTTFDNGPRLADETPAPLVRPYHPSDAQAWDEFVRCESSASFFHLSGWMRVMERTFGYRECALLAERAGRITGVLPLFEIKNWVLGRCLISSPFAVYGGIAAADQESYSALLQYVQGMARDRHVEYLELRSRDGELQPGFHANSRYATFTCDLSSDSESNLKRLPKDTRYMIRKGQKQGLTVHHGLDRLTDFYQLFTTSLRRLGTPSFPKRLLSNLLAEFPGQIDLLMLYAGQHAVSGVFTFLFRDTVLPYYAGASPDAPRLAANNLMYWELMQWATERDYRCFDFGRSKTGTGPYAFKSQWNMTVSPLNYQILLVEKKTVPNFSPANPRFDRATRAWSRLPLWLTRKAGPHIVKWFP
ncbi:MAG: FemAB family XrtA/PEP-CTERM system-associated protein [Actinomycetota bacterium]